MWERSGGGRRRERERLGPSPDERTERIARSRRCYLRFAYRWTAWLPVYFERLLSYWSGTMHETLHTTFVLYRYPVFDTVHTLSPSRINYHTFSYKTFKLHFSLTPVPSFGEAYPLNEISFSNYSTARYAILTNVSCEYSAEVRYSYDSSQAW